MELHKELKVLKPAFLEKIFLHKERWVLAGSYRYFATRECGNAQVGVNPG